MGRVTDEPVISGSPRPTHFWSSLSPFSSGNQNRMGTKHQVKGRGNEVLT